MATSPAPGRGSSPAPALWAVGCRSTTAGSPPPHRFTVLRSSRRTATTTGWASMSYASKVCLSLSIALAAVLAIGGHAVAAAPDEILGPGLTLGIQDDHLAVDPLATLPERVATIASTGVSVSRVDVLWADVAPTRPADAADPNDPAYRWARYDAVVDDLVARGIAPILDLYRTPSWANGGRGRQWAPNPDDYQAFVTALARRYSGSWRDRDGRVHARVALFEAWNEPTIPSFLSPQWELAADGTATPASPAIYATLLARAYAAVKRVQPDAWVIGVSGAPNGSDNPPDGSMGIITFLRALAPFAPPMDAAAQHLYPAQAPSVSVAMPSFRRLPEVIAAVDAVRPGLPILITEMGWTTAATPYRRSFVSEAEQAANLREAVDLLRAEPRVRLGVWFNLQDNPDWPGGLVRADDSRKPAWDVFLGLPKRFPPLLPAPPGAAEAPPAEPPAPAAPAAPVATPTALSPARPRIGVGLVVPGAVRVGARALVRGAARLADGTAPGGTCVLVRGGDGRFIARGAIDRAGRCRLALRPDRPGRLGVRLRVVPEDATLPPALSGPAVVVVRPARR